MSFLWGWDGSVLRLGTCLYCSFSAQLVQGIASLGLAEGFGFLDDLFENLDALVVGLAVDRIGDTIFAAVGEAVAGRVGVGGRGAVNNFRNQGEGADGFGADTGGGQELFIGGGLVFGESPENFFEIFGFTEILGDHWVVFEIIV